MTSSTPIYRLIRDTLRILAGTPMDTQARAECIGNLKQVALLVEAEVKRSAINE